MVSQPKTAAKKLVSATSYANCLLARLNLPPLSDEPHNDIHPAINNARSGVQGHALPLRNNKSIPVALADYADGALLALKSLTSNNPVPENLPANLPANLPECGASLLGERMALFNTQSGGDVSAGGTCHFFKAQDGCVALNLARDEDFALLPALTNGQLSSESSLPNNAFEGFNVAALVSRGRELGLAISPVKGANLANSQAIDDWVTITHAGKPPTAATPAKPLVVDLSSLWAGPLAGSLLAMLGAEVIKVESTNRLDGARRDDSDKTREKEFFDLLNGEKKSFTCDFTSPNERQHLHKLIECADIVIEASRPRALKQLGIHAEKLVAAKPGKVWLSMTAYGRYTENTEATIGKEDLETENIIGFGDDIGVAAGLSALMEIAHGRPLFAGDAIADPMGGLHGALAAWSCWVQRYEKGGGMIDLSLYRVLRFALSQDPLLRDLTKVSTHDLKNRMIEWDTVIGKSDDTLYPLRKAAKTAPKAGQDNDEILRKLDAY